MYTQVHTRFITCFVLCDRLHLSQRPNIHQELVYIAWQHVSSMHLMFECFFHLVILTHLVTAVIETFHPSKPYCTSFSIRLTFLLSSWSSWMCLAAVSFSRGEMRGDGVTPLQSSAWPFTKVTRARVTSENDTHVMTSHTVQHYAITAHEQESYLLLWFYHIQ